MVWSFVYLAVRSLFALVLLFGRSDRSKELEILVLRHQLAVLRRRSGRPRIERSDRALLATLSRALPRRRWATFSVSPEMVLRWHRQLVTRRWTYPRVKLGRPPLERPRRELILRLARENPHWAWGSETVWQSISADSVSSTRSARGGGFAGYQGLISRDRIPAARQTNRARLTSTRRIWYPRARVKPQ
jgi:hypothetical protein